MKNAPNVGTEVYYWKGAKIGEPSGKAKVRSAASYLGGTKVVWLQGVAGCIALTHIKVVK